MNTIKIKQPSLFSAIAIGVGCMIGSGWLFASYYAAQSTGALSILSWIIGATMVLILALLLSEVCTMFPKRALLARILTISHHNRDFGFVVAISNWLGLVITIPSEAEASVQYLSTAYPKLAPYLFAYGHLTYFGLACVLFLLIIYGTLNFWGIRLLAKANNIIVIFKVGIPILTAFILIFEVFHPTNFTIYHNTIAPYGLSSAFTTVVTCGIFYAFYGFATISFFCTELKNPKRNIPLALVSAIILCLFIYLLLQIAFIGALPPHLIENGWHRLHFISPLAQLLMLLGLNIWAFVLYLDAVISPSGTASLYTGTAARNFTGMSRDQQMPSFFNKLHPIYAFSRRSLIFTLSICFVMVLFFRNWQKIMIVVSVFQLITCTAIPIAFYRLRVKDPQRERTFRMPFGKLLSVLIFILVNYLLAQAGTKALFMALLMHVILFLFYGFSFYKGRYHSLAKSFKSSWSIFIYLIFAVIFAYLVSLHLLLNPYIFAGFIVLSLLNFKWLIEQKNYQDDADEQSREGDDIKDPLLIPQ